MKSIQSILLLAAALFIFGACEKDYVCDCTYNDPNVLGSDNTTESFEYKSKTKEDAEDLCEDQEDDFQENEDGGASCTLKRQ